MDKNKVQKVNQLRADEFVANDELSEKLDDLEKRMDRLDEKFKPFLEKENTN